MLHRHQPGSTSPEAHRRRRTATAAVSSPGRDEEAVLSLSEAHELWAWVVIVANGAMGVWALAAHWAPVLRRRALWWGTAAAEVALVAQVVLGVVVLQDREAPEFHTFYGFVALASVGIIYSYRQQVEPWRYLLYGFGGLFLMGLGLRAVFLT